MLCWNIYVIALWLIMAESFFVMLLCTVFLHSPTIILTLTRRTAVVCEGFCTKGRTCLHQQILVRNSVCYQILPFVLDHNRGPIWPEMNVNVLVFFSLVFLIVDHVQKLWVPSVKAFIISSSTGNCSVGSRAIGNWFKSPASCCKHLNFSWRVGGEKLLKTR